MSDTPTKYRSYPSFEDPPPRAISMDALLGKVIRRLFEDGARREDGLAGTLQAVLRALDHPMSTASKRTS
ncbi:hypothetical protein FV232_11105 [Methylobacterium sp. WL30]|uniref:hypothetical protein n=1 Tax=unclassified Methylobacterium TaxID=2615210 RepID=UPI0011C95A58|nr:MULTISPECIES: hypothetical protein [unclassified Methylobacterium]TXN41693.1 hypothetical protein FV225_01495 [Methylobacterium sp. WL93]TXN49119.1 hypothetical protein FV227_18165 [Methylobacterium sp. WL119]TXN67799.1 hypothetical protein FV232_11105 [Methylobacterium sp. WL30]TXN75985.1 hypothetical protein FV228_01760 [Methylobacterium sp. WL18]